MRIGPGLVVAAAALCAALAIGSLVWQGNLPYQGYTGEGVVVIIEPGQPARVAAASLQQAGVIRSAMVFRLLMRARSAEGRIHAGEYAFSGPITPSQVLGRLLRGDVVRHRLTIPEGLRRDEVADLAAASGFGSREAFLRATADPRPIADLDPEARDLEGYLFPDTYFFARGVPEDRIVGEMVARFRREMTPQRIRRARELGFGIREIVTLASLVEKEARLDAERPRIAAVFQNRLRIQMRLQCDPTVVYALVRDGRYRGDIYRTDLAYGSPYNTYVHSGLPPGPICNAGSRSLEATLYPADTEELYFVVSGPGRHEFSTNMRDHERAVRRYRRELGLANR